MTKIAILVIVGNKFELHVIVGSENEAAVDISKLRDMSGVITLDPGYKNSDRYCFYLALQKKYTTR